MIEKPSASSSNIFKSQIKFSVCFKYISAFDHWIMNIKWNYQINHEIYKYASLTPQCDIIIFFFLFLYNVITVCTMLMKWIGNCFRINKNHKLILNLDTQTPNLNRLNVCTWTIRRCSKIKCFLTCWLIRSQFTRSEAMNVIGIVISFSCQSTQTVKNPKRHFFLNLYQLSVGKTLFFNSTFNKYIEIIVSHEN